MADAKAAADVSQTYPTLQAGDIFGVERGGVFGKTTFAQLQAQDLTLTGDNAFTGAVDLSGATVTWEADTANIADDAVTAAKLDATASAALVPSGAVMSFAMNSAPTGWLDCDGAAVSRTTYAALFAAIGTTFGVGDGSTTFNLPDLRGEFVRGWDDGRGVDTSRAFGSAQADELRAHTHTQTTSGWDQDQGTNLGDNVSGTPAARSTRTAATATGSTGGSETRPRNIALIYCIKV